MPCSKSLASDNDAVALDVMREVDDTSRGMEWPRRQGMTGWLKSRLPESGWLLFWIIASSVWCVSASARLSATFDEPTYLTLGLESWRTRSYKPLLDLGTLPLPCQVQTLPLHLWERWRGEQLDPTTDIERLLPIARMGTLPFWWLLLLYGWLAGRQIAGVWGGRLSVVFLACEPNLLAHASLATTDVAVTACLLALLYHFRAARDASWRRRVLVPAMWFALAVLAKASGLVFGIIGMAIMSWNCASMDCPRTELDGRDSTALGCERLCSETVSTGSLIRCGPSACSRSFVFAARRVCLRRRSSPGPHNYPDGPVRSTMVWTAEHLCIFSNAGVALVRQIRHNVQGHGVFLLDQVQKRAIWYYFPVALEHQFSSALLLSLPLILPISAGRMRNWAVSRPWLFCYSLCLSSANGDSPCPAILSSHRRRAGGSTGCRH